MRPTLPIIAAVLGLSSGIAATWFVMRRTDHSAPSAANTPAAVPEKTVLYWYDPMAPNRHFDKPGKSPTMDMQLVPKYASGADEGAGVVRIDPREVQNLGVRTARAERGTLTSEI